MTTLPELIGLLESATGPSRELDESVLEFVNPEQFQWCVCESIKRQSKALDNGLTGRGDACHRAAFSSTPQYTSSLDAALTLVPEGYAWHVWSNRYLLSPDKPDTFGASVEIASNKLWCDGKPSGPIALCIAALRSRLTQDGEI